MSWLLRRESGRRAPLAVFGTVLAVVIAQLVALGGAGAGYGGGYGGTGGDGIWALAWWLGNPAGGGPYTGPPASASGICIWHDTGSTVKDLGGALGEAGLPSSFWTAPQSGGHSGIWGVLRWAAPLAEHETADDHFDLVACPYGSQVPDNGGDVESDLPQAHPPSGPPVWLWIFWDTVPDPQAGDLPPVVEEAYHEIGLPSPVIAMSPSEVAGIENATAVNLETWLWLANAEDWRTYVASATAGPYTATVWAYPVSVTWTAGWNFPERSLDPERGTTFGPESLHETCDGPGAPYPVGSGACTAVFRQSTLGGRAPLYATVDWVVHWALSDGSGVVGGEGVLPDVHTTSRVWLRVIQVESIIQSG